MTDQSASNPADHAGVRLPPPLIYVVFFGLALLLHLVAPLAIAPSIVVRAAALILLVGGLVLIGSSNVLFRRANTSLMPIKPASALVQGGVYRLTRNPMYLGLLCVYIAAALWFGLIWPLVLAPLLIVAMQRLVIAKEEAYLDRRFGDDYRQYRAHVRRWI